MSLSQPGAPARRASVALSQWSVAENQLSTEERSERGSFVGCIPADCGVTKNASSSAASSPAASPKK